MVLKAKEIRELTPEDRIEKLKELKEELMHERGVSAMGGSPPSPGKIRQIRTSIARILTIMREEGENKWAIYAQNAAYPKRFVYVKRLLENSRI